MSEGCATWNTENFIYASCQQLSRDMSKIVNRKIFSDVHFIVGATKEKIYGHKCILSARSPIFKQLFTNDIDRNSFDLWNVTPLSFILLLYFLYTNSVSFDRLNIAEVYDLMITSEDYRCPELAQVSFIECVSSPNQLAESHLSTILDPNNVFQYLTLSIDLKKSLITEAAIDLIEEHSATILTPTNTNLLTLSSEALTMILQSDLLELDELKVVEVACYWAENILRKAKEAEETMERGTSRTSIVTFSPIRFGNSQDMIDQTLPMHYDRKSSLLGLSQMMQDAKENIDEVMSAIRFALIPQYDLIRLEEEQQTKRIIPQHYFINAWRLIAMREFHLPYDDPVQAKIQFTPRKGTLSRAARRKSYADPAAQWRRMKSASGRMPDLLG